MLTLPLYSSERDFQEEAKELFKSKKESLNQSILDFDTPKELLPISDRDKEAHPNQMKEDLLNVKNQQNEVVGFLESHPIDHSLVSENETFLSDPQKELSDEYIHICQESAKEVPFSVIRTLQCEIDKNTIEEKTFIQKCQGHTKTKKVSRGKGESEVKKIEKEYFINPNIQSFHISNKDRGAFHRDELLIHYKHIDDYSLCSNYKKTPKSLEREEPVIKEQWDYQNPSLKRLAEDSHSSFISTTCLDHSTKTINGVQLDRCWVEKLSFLYRPKKVTGCDFLKSHFCKLKSSECLKRGPLGCLLWERKFTCYKDLKKKNTPDPSIIESSLNELSWDTEYEPNHGFSDVAMKFEIFNEMDKELKEATPSEIRNFQFFSGKKRRCYIHSLKENSYDCCEKMGGLGVNSLIASCDEEELALFDMRSRGQCVYIGDKSLTTVGIKTSKKKVFCCFSSKLGRVFNEQARSQLNISWGDSDHPNCHGLTQANIEKLDFDKIDLSEAYDSLPEDLSERMERLKNKITSGMEK